MAGEAAAPQEEGAAEPGKEGGNAVPGARASDGLGPWGVSESERAREERGRSAGRGVAPLSSSLVKERGRRGSEKED